MVKALGLNKVFSIYNEDGTAFHDLVLRKATVDSVVMSLSDKITGDVYYKDNGLQVTMHEYIEFQRSEKEEPTKYVLVNPPTIVREGVVSANSDLKGMTKYSFEFYHPMYVLSNIPFTDVAVSNDEKQYKSQDRTFSWIGYLEDFIAKLNKNLDGTEWCVVRSESLDGSDKLSMLSEVLSFDKNFISDALKTCYETWDVPFVIDNVSSERQTELYSQGKRYMVVFGLPANDIYDIDEQGDSTGKVYVFKMGQGLGLKNNSRTPKNNKIVTRIAGYGSEDNIPYGYPQIVWTGDPTWNYTINNASGMQQITIGGETVHAMSYPIYKGIVGGEWVQLIKHPFTRKNLMPSIYGERVNKKVNPYAQGYNPDIELVDYYDAISDSDYHYPNEITLEAPSFDVHQFEDIKPELGEKTILEAYPINDKDQERAEDWDDSINDNGEYNQGYFKVVLPKLDFDIYACAALTQEMKINMRSGACIGCTFTVQVDWEYYKQNFYDADGNFVPHSSKRDLKAFPNSMETQITLILQKDTQTFGVLMPNIYQKPIAGDEFVILGISLPLSYIKNAEKTLDEQSKAYMLENNVYYYEYPLTFDEHFLATRSEILAQIRPNSVIRFLFNEELQNLYVKQITIKYGDSVLPQYSITLTDDVEVVLNQIGQTVEDVERLNVLVSQLRVFNDKNIALELTKKLSKVSDDTSLGTITSAGFLANLMQSREFASGLAGLGFTLRVRDDGTSYLEVDEAMFRRRAIFNEIEIRKLSYSGGNILFSAAGSKLTKVEGFYGEYHLYGKSEEEGEHRPLHGEQKQLALRKVRQAGEDYSFYRCYFETDNGTTETRNWWHVGDFAMCQTFNVARDGEFVGNHYYWRKVIGVGSNYIDLSNVAGEMASEFVDANGNPIYTDNDSTTLRTSNDEPMAGDEVVQLGADIDQDRQNAIMLSVVGRTAPEIRQLSGINTFSLQDKTVTLLSPSGNLITGTFVLQQSNKTVEKAIADESGWSKDAIAESLGYEDGYEQMEAEAERQRTIIKGAYINTQLIDADTILTRQLVTKTEGGQGVIIRNRVAEFFGETGACNIRMGVDNSGYAVLQFFDNDGTLLYDLGVNGLRHMDVTQAGYITENWTALNYDDAQQHFGNNFLAGAFGKSTITPITPKSVYRFRAKRVNGTIVFDGTYALTTQQAQSEDGKLFAEEAAPLDDTKHLAGVFAINPPSSEEKVMRYMGTSAPSDYVANDYLPQYQITNWSSGVIYMATYYIATNGVTSQYRVYITQDNYKTLRQPN